VLKAFNVISYTSFFLVTDKSRFERPGGFAYKRSFFKNLHNRLYQRICRSPIPERLAYAVSPLNSPKVASVGDSR
jgi:hypothetical protein